MNNLLFNLIARIFLRTLFINGIIKNKTEFIKVYKIFWREIFDFGVGERNMLQQNPTPKQEKKNATNGIFERKRWETHA